MSKIGHFRRKQLAVIGFVLLMLLYGLALLADFLAPYPEKAENRSLFFHPPSTIHIRDEMGSFVWPYIVRTHLVDQSRHLFQEGSPIRIGIFMPDMNRNPYVPESIEQEAPLVTIRDEHGKVAATIYHVRETAEDTGIFAGRSALKHAGNSFSVETGKGKSIFRRTGNEYVTDANASGVLLLNAEGQVIRAYRPSFQKYRLRFFVRGSAYKLFGIYPTNLHLFGVEPPGRIFLLGTDQTGRDIFSRILFGSRISLTVGLIGVFISTVLGLFMGGIAGYFGGKIDGVLMRGVDVLLSIPALYLILSVRNVFPTDLTPSATYPLMIIVLSLTGWAGMARVIRGMVLSLREEEYVTAARAMGAGWMRILVLHILPNTFGYVIIRATLLIPAYILAEVTLSYLGIGVQEPQASWGNMLSAAQELRVLEDFTWVLSPGIFLFITVLAFHLVGDGLRDAQRNTGF